MGSTEEMDSDSRKMKKDEDFTSLLDGLPNPTRQAWTNVNKDKLFQDFLERHYIIDVMFFEKVLK